MLPKKLAFVDIETTGLRSGRDRVIEVGVIRVEDDVVTSEYQSLLNPQCYIPNDIELLTGITKKELDFAPTFTQIAKELRDILTDCVFVAHNVRFDYGFLKNEFRREEISFSPKHFCTVKLSRRLFPTFTKHNLDSIIERYNIPCKKRHRAFDDAKVLFTFYQHIQKQFTEDEVAEAISTISKRPSLPVSLSHEDIENLPKTTGVYLFYGEEDVPLYIGKSKNIKDRVVSHFLADHTNSTEMKIAQQIKTIKTIVTPGEIGALLKESELIKKLQPLYNRKLRNASKPVCLVSEQNDEGYNTVVIKNIDTFTPALLHKILGVFKGQKKAKEYLAYISEEHFLCNKLLGLEKTTKECFSHRLEKCKGACVKKEKALFYNVRFIQAFGKTKISPWPFEGPIAIVEKDQDTQGGSLHFVHEWCYFGTYTYDSADENYSTIEELTHLAKDDPIPFDNDTYTILKRFLSTGNSKQIISLSQKDTNFLSRLTSSL